MMNAGEIVRVQNGMNVVADIFDIAGVDRQRDIQCATCPDPRPAMRSAEELALISRCNIRAHRCHTTPNALCAGQHRPRILA
jgi:hypothetical protein